MHLRFANEKRRGKMLTTSVILQLSSGSQKRGITQG